MIDAGFMLRGAPPDAAARYAARQRRAREAEEVRESVRQTI